nr:MAG TPA: hypothetical protein [Caudoviricetes sp.]DAU54207.1 MAG TPA: hypothetical protein [Bacteriophage sp.]
MGKSYSIDTCIGQQGACRTSLFIESVYLAINKLPQSVQNPTYHPCELLVAVISTMTLSHLAALTQLERNT